MSCPCRMMAPERRGKRPIILSIVVVLPAPLRPTRQTTSRSCTLRDSPCKICAEPRNVWSWASSSLLAMAVLLTPPRLRRRRAPSLTGARSPRLRRRRGRSLTRPLPQERRRHQCVGADSAWCAVGENCPLVHHHNAIRVGKHHVHVVLDNRRRDVPLAHDGRNRVHHPPLV